MGHVMSTGKDNDELIDKLVEANFIRSAEIERIFRAVNRGNYFLTEQKRHAYHDSAWRAGNLHLSSPYVYCGVMESLNLRPGLSFLNLGSGCGYLSTMAGLILGSYGVNHGVEIYKDVVDYAYDRLDDFMKRSDAVVEYDFCEPTFVSGNCLKIDSVQLYDRVYCGADCPLEYEIYMKHLIKVGGLVVLPLNNKLLQITRTTASTWQTVNILSALFAPLISPSDTEPANFVQLPEFSPPPLQVLCRSRIRTILKSRIDEEHPILQEKKIERCRNRQRLRRLVIPVLNQNDSSDSGNDSDSSDSGNDSDSSDSGYDMEFRSPSEGITHTIGPCTPTQASSFVRGFLHARRNIQGIVAGPSNWNTVSETSAASGNKTEKVGTAEKTERNQTKKEGNDEDSFTSNSCASSDNDTKIISNAALIDEHEIGANLTSPPPDETLASKKPCLTKRGHSGSSPGTSKGKKRVKLSPKKRVPPSSLVRHAHLICKELPSTCQSAVKRKEEAANKTPENDTVNYRSLMAKKILSLPLPKRVQVYVNYGQNNM